VTNPGPVGRTAPLSVRRAVLADSASIARFQTACWREAYRGVVPQEFLDRVGVAEREVRWRDRLATRSREVALAELDSSVVGVVSWAATGLPSSAGLDLLSLYVGAEQRGTGLANELLQAAVGTRPAHLWVFEDNPRAHAFYRKHGFGFSGHHQVDPGTGLSEQMWVRH
jgi:ribosomal protein S18 acetylase RimI-like enzyme